MVEVRNMAQALSRRHLVAEAWVLSQTSPYGVFGGRIFKRKGFYRSTVEICGCVCTGVFQTLIHFFLALCLCCFVYFMSFEVFSLTFSIFIH